jgi:hypothetical protein
MLLVEQARMLVQGEEARFIATQSRATTLLAVGGVLAGIGATVSFRFAEREFPWPCHPFGTTISVAAVIAVILAVVAVGSLIYASVIALGVMRQEIKLKMRPTVVNRLIAVQFPKLLEDDQDQAARIVLGLLADLHRGGQKANSALKEALWRCGVWLGVAVATGLTLGVFALAVGSQHRHVQAPFPSRPHRDPVSATSTSKTGPTDRANLFL